MASEIQVPEMVEFGMDPDEEIIPEPVGDEEMVPEPVGVETLPGPVEEIPLTEEEIRRQQIEDEMIPVGDIDFGRAGERGYLFEAPIVPEGYEAVYGEIERDPFRADWSEAEFRIPESYTGRRLTDEERSLYEEADDYLFNLKNEATSNGFSSVENYIAALQQYDPDAYYNVQESLNTYAPIVNELGDIYQYERALRSSQFRADQGEVDLSDSMDVVTNFVGYLVQSGTISAEDAAYLLNDPQGVAQILQGGIAGVTPPPPAAPEFHYFDDDPDRQRPYVISNGEYVPWVDPDWTVYNGSYYQDSDGDNVPEFVRPVGDYEDRPGIAGVSEETEGTDSEGRKLIFSPNDPENQRPHVVVDTGNNRIDIVPALMPGEFVESGGRVVREDGTVVRDSLEYDIGYFDEVTVDDEGNTVVVGGSEGVDSIPPESFPITPDGVYDIETDIERSGSDVMGMYFDPNSRLSITEEIRTNFGRWDEDDQARYLEQEWVPPARPGSPSHSGQGGQRTGEDSGGVSEDGGYRFVMADDSEVFPSIFATRERTNYLNRKEKNKFADRLLDGRFLDIFGFDKPNGAAVKKMMNPKKNKAFDFRFFDEPLMQEFFLEKINDYMEVTGKTLGSIAMSTHEDIFTGSEDPNEFDIQDFIVGSEELGWGGIIDDMRTLASDFDLGSFGSDNELTTRDALQGFAFFASGLTLPIYNRINEESERRLDGGEFAQNQSIPSWYTDTYGEGAIPDYLETVPPLPMPEGEGPGLIPGNAAGGYIGGTAGGMDDTVPAVTDGESMAALSSGEFVIPADVVSHLGDGNNQNGASKLYKLMDDIRISKTGSTEQPDPINDGIVSNLIGGGYGQ